MDIIKDNYTIININEIKEMIDEIGKMTYGLIKSLKTDD